MNTNTPSAPASRTPEYIKIPNVPGLYRHTRSGRYYGVKKVNEKRRERSLDTTDRRIAEARLREWIFSLEKVDREVEKMTLSELTKSFVAINQGKANNSIYIMRSVVEELQEFLQRKGLGDLQVRNIRTSHLEEWLAKQERRLKNSSYNRYTGVIKQLFALAVRDRILVESPFDKVRVRWKKPQTPKRLVPTLEQFEAIIKEVRAAPFTIHAESSGDFLEFLGLAGVGQAEAASLTWGEVNFKKGIMHFRRHKTDQRFTVPIYPHLRPFMEGMREKAGKQALSGERVFKIEDGKTALTNACKRLGFQHFTQRNLRQCLILRLWKAGVDKKLIAKWQGHQDGGQLILDTYTEVFGSDDDEYEAQQLAKLSTGKTQEVKEAA